jgi:hypothetical protein
LVQETSPTGDVVSGERHRFFFIRSVTSQAILTFVILCAISSLPVLITKMPAMIDYPNHLGRLYIIGHQADPLLAKFYQITWRPIPDLASDVIVPILNRVVNIFTAGKLAVLLIMGLIVSGTYALHYALYKNWTGSAVSFLFLFNGIFMYGFLNYLFSIGLALWATAGWIALRDRPWWWRSAYSVCAVSVLFLSHLVGVGLYALAIFCYEGSRIDGTNRGRLALFSDAAAVLLPFLIVIPLILSTLGIHALSATEPSHLTRKWLGLYDIFRNAHVVCDAISFCFLLLFFGFLLYRRRIAIPRLGWMFLMFAGLVYLIVPEWVFHVWGIDTRLPAAFVFFVIAMVRWRIESPVGAVIFNSIIMVAVATRVVGVSYTWRVYDKIAADYEKSFAQIEPGSRILVTWDDSADWQKSTDGGKLGMDQEILWHLPVLAVIERSSLVSTIFAHSGNPLSIRAPYRDAIPIDRKLSLRVGDLSSPDRALSPHGYVRNWRDYYDYLYVQFAFPGSHPNLTGVKLIYQGASFQLYKVDPSNGLSGETPSN